MRDSGMNTTHTVRKVNYPENDNSAKDVSILWYMDVSILLHGELA